ncbi:hypothetical protein CWO89_15295 [Bradyrhizobium sp. Leo170]|nr:hypothetical protein CWO89_15295 [Bradyrhizobium sp. Leo170]
MDERVVSAQSVCVKSVNTNHNAAFSPCAGCERRCYNRVIEAEHTSRARADDILPALELSSDT